MKVNRTGSNQISRSASKTKSTKKTEFAAELQQINPTGETNLSPVSGVHAAEGVEALWALQEIGIVSRDGVLPPKEKAARLLDLMQDLQQSLLSDAFPHTALEALTVTIRRQCEDTDDPKLREVLAEIELRAAVELAKWHRNESPDSDLP